MRTGTSLVAMPNLSNQSCTSRVECRCRIERRRTSSTCGSCEQKATRLKSRSSSVAGRASSRDTSSTMSWNSGRMAILHVPLTALARILAGRFEQMSKGSADLCGTCPLPASVPPSYVRRHRPRPGGNPCSVPPCSRPHAALGSTRRHQRPGSRRLVDRFVAGETLDDALDASRRLVERRPRRDPRPSRRGHAGREPGRRHPRDLRRPARPAGRPGPGGPAEVSVKLSAFGQALPGDGHDIALENARPSAPRASRRAPR